MSSLYIKGRLTYIKCLIFYSYIFKHSPSVFLKMINPCKEVKNKKIAELKMKNQRIRHLRDCSRRKILSYPLCRLNMNLWELIDGQIQMLVLRFWGDLRQAGAYLNIMILKWVWGGSFIKIFGENGFIICTCIRRRGERN